MNVLVLAPVMSKNLCDDYYLYKNLHEKGVNLAFVTGTSSGSTRANYSKLLPYENIDGFPIHRLYKNYKYRNEMLFFPRKRLKEILNIAKELKPDLILCHLSENMRLALLVQKHLKIPIVLHVEITNNIVNSEFMDSRKMRIAKRLIGLPTRGSSFWSWLCEKADALITSDPPDQQILNLLSKHGKPVYYLPWPANIPEDCDLSPTRDKYRAIYVGWLAPYKNTQELEWAIPLILQNTPTKEFIIIGTVSAAHVPIVKRLQEQYGDAIKHIPKLGTRCEILKYISGSYYAFSPVRQGGWGFLGDCWGTRTPLLMLNNVFLSNTLDLCVAKSREDLVRKINQLYEDPHFYRQMQDSGYDMYTKRSTNTVGDELYSILQRTLEKNRV
jgi:glycosyltransferase involved in cell wall biosynthesis